LTDYLEELLDNTEALLEQVRRLERGVFGTASGEETGEGEAPLPPERPNEEASLSPERPREEVPLAPARLKEKLWSALDTAPESERDKEAASRAEMMEKETALEPPGRILTPLEEEKPEDSSALLEQLEQMERAAASASGMEDGTANRSAAWGETGGRGQGSYSVGPDGARRGSMYPGVTGTAGENRPLGAGFGEPVSQPAEELRWAERADRAFRRDSRRYDGDFYLY